MADKNKEVIIAYLEDAREQWLESRAGAERAGHMSAALNSIEDQDMEYINTLLDEFNALGSLAVNNASL